MTKQEITRIALVALTVFCLLLAGNALYKKYWVEKNLTLQVGNIAGVVAAQIVESDGKNELDVQTRNVTDLPQICEKLDNISRGVPIRFIDSRSAELTDLYREMQFALQEGIATGNFTQMAGEIKDQAKKAGAEVQVDVDGKRIYLVLSKGGAQLVSVLERQDPGLYLSGAGNES